MMKGFLFVVTLCLCSCALFKKTNKNTAVSTQSSTNQLKSSQLLLKTAGKETQTYTYWNDSGFYQYQHIKEQLDGTELTKVETEGEQHAKQTNTTKKTEPVSTWVCIAVLLGLIGCYSIFRKCWPGILSRSNRR